MHAQPMPNAPVKLAEAILLASWVNVTLLLVVSSLGQSYLTMH